MTHAHKINGFFWIQWHSSYIFCTGEIEIRMIDLITEHCVCVYGNTEKNLRRKKNTPNSSLNSWFVQQQQQKNARCINNALQRVKVRINKNALPYDDV